MTEYLLGLCLAVLVTNLIVNLYDIINNKRVVSSNYKVYEGTINNLRQHLEHALDMRNK